MEHHCIICLGLRKTKTANVSKAFLRNCSSPIVRVCSRIFNVDIEKFVGNFSVENIYFCTECSMYVKKLTELFTQLELIEKTIKNVVKETKIKILLSNVKKRSHREVNEQNKNWSTDSFVRDYFRNRAIKDLNPTVNLQRLANKTIANPESDVDLQSRKSDVKKGTKYLDDFENFLMVKNEFNSEIWEIKSENIDDTEQNINESQENDLTGSLPLEKPVITRNVANNVKTRKEKRNKVVDNMAKPNGEENSADDDDQPSETEKSITDTRLQNDEVVLIKKIKAKRCKLRVRKGVDYTLKQQPDSAECSYQCGSCYKQFHKERNVQIHVRRIHWVAVDYGEENGADDDNHLNYSSAESNAPEPDKSIPNKRSHNDRVDSIKKIKAKRCRRRSRKGVDYTLKKKTDSAEYSYQCETCYKQFHKERNVQIHIRRIHWVEKLYEDGNILTQKGKLKRIACKPINLGDGKWSYKNFEYTKDSSSGKCICVCVSCGKIFDNRDCVKSLHQHINTVHGGNKLNADGKVLTQKGKVKKIFSCKSVHLGGGKWSYKNFEYTKDNSSRKCTCVSCDKIFDNRNPVTSILQHINTFHGANNRLTVDGKVLTQKGKVKKIFSCRAIDLGGGKWLYKNFVYTKDSSSEKSTCICDSCGKIFDNRLCIQSVHQHIKIAHVARLNKEHLKKFTVKGRPRKPHLPIKLEGGERWCNGMEFRIEKDPEDIKKKLYHCGLCDYVCGTANSVKRHISMKHLNPGSRICYICEEIFPSKNSYDQHVSSHNHSKSATCEECGETFKYRSALYPHIRRVHLGERPYICEFCGKRFFTRKDCRVHSATHNNTNQNTNSKQDTPKIQNADSFDLMY